MEDFLLWVTTNHGERGKKNTLSGWWCGACGKPYGKRQLNGLLSLQIGDAVHEHVVLSVYGAPDGECDHLICTLKLSTNSTKWINLGIVDQKSAESSENQILEELRQFIAVDNARVLVKMGEFARYREAKPIVLPDFDKDTYPHACVVVRDDAMSLRREEQEIQQLFVDTSKIPAASGLVHSPVVELFVVAEYLV